jgi:hypothetical protein
MDRAREKGIDAMKRLKSPYLWFKIALAAGLLLSLTLLVQSVVTYYHVSRQMVTEQLTREADRQILTLERGLRQSASRSPEQIQAALKESLDDAPKKIAWIRVIDSAGEVIAQAGEAVGPPLVVANQPPEPSDRERPSEMRDTQRLDEKVGPLIMDRR